MSEETRTPTVYVIAGLWNLFELYEPILDEWWLYNGSVLPPELVAQKID